jgi:hypothetical protein
MKRPPSTAIFGVTFLWFASRLFGEPTAADVKALLESRPALHAAITEHQTAETMLNVEIEPAMKAA